MYCFTLDFSIKNAKNVNIANFNSDVIEINAIENIHIEKCQGEQITLNTFNGNIISKNVLQAANIKLQTHNGVRIFE